MSSRGSTFLTKRENLLFQVLMKEITYEVIIKKSMNFKDGNTITTFSDHNTLHPEIDITKISYRLLLLNYSFK